MAELNQIESPIGTVFLPQDDAAAYLKKSRATFLRLRKKHKIPHFRHGGTLLFKRADLDAYLDSCFSTLASK